ncbi:MAG: ferritin family protein [Nitrospinae bacterium]|nr:ferritin family protein [Nitrospinota bacterium]
MFGCSMDITNQELLEISLKIERDGKRFYRQLAEIVTDPKVRDFFHLMYKEEALHEKQFKRIIESKKLEQFGWEDNPSLREFIDKEFQTDIFPPAKEVIGQLPQIGGIQKALEIAMDAERIVAEFFRLLHDSCNDIEIKTVLTILEKSESEHLERVKSFRTKFLNDTN